MSASPAIRHAHHHGHGHHGHGHGHARNAPRRALALALALTLAFMVVELVVGLWSGSLALLADAGHMLNDAAALALSLGVTFIAARPRDDRLTFGYRRAEVMGALLNGLALGAAGVWIIIEAIERLSAPPDVRGIGMLATAILGLLVNLLAAWILLRSGGENLNVRAALMHVLSDALGSMAAIVAGVLVLGFGLRLADPIASLAISALILFGAGHLLWDTSRVLMQGAPAGLDVAAVKDTIVATDGVAAVCDLHVWELVPGEPILSAHVVLSGSGEEPCEVAIRVGEALADGHGINHVTIQPRDTEGGPTSCGERRAERSAPSKVR